MTLLWDKGGAAPDARVQRFLAGDDARLDATLLPYDVRASRAHVDGLARIGILSDTERAALDGELAILSDDFAAGRFVIDARFEDGHSAIEARLVEKLGDVGKKVHTGRSRNDQVLVALRLYLRDALDALARACCNAARALLHRAHEHRLAPMPGYTHLQRAVPSSIGLWLGGLAEGFLDDAELAQAVARWADRSPLGTAAGYGVNLPLDRTGVAAALGFAAVQHNPLATQNARGKTELVALAALEAALLDVRRLAWDLSLFATAEFGFVRLPDRLTTGSSIMPNKRNPDLVELLRAAYATVAGGRVEIAAVLSLPSGYHRDLQATKGPLLRAVEHGLAALGLVPDLVASLGFDEARLRGAITSDMFATDRAVELVKSGVPFRDAYRRVAAELDALDGRTPEESLAQRTSPGALDLDALDARLGSLSGQATSGNHGPSRP